MKFNSHLVIGACLAALALTASAAPKKDASPGSSASPATDAAAASPSMSAPRGKGFRGVVASVDASAKTFTIEGKKKSRVFSVTDKTKITKAGAAATFADIAAKDRVSGSFTKREDGSLEADTVKIGAAPSAEKPRSARKSKKEAAGETGESPSPSASPTK